MNNSSSYKVILELFTLAHVRFGKGLKVVEAPYVFRAGSAETAS